MQEIPGWMMSLGGSSFSRRDHSAKKHNFGGRDFRRKDSSYDLSSSSSSSSSYHNPAASYQTPAAVASTLYQPQAQVQAQAYPQATMAAPFVAAPQQTPTVASTLDQPQAQVQAQAGTLGTRKRPGSPGGVLPAAKRPAAAGTLHAVELLDAAPEPELLSLAVLVSDGLRAAADPPRRPRAPTGRC
eukprot:TRINITY_DN10321_c0_g1_i1.p3 TRINITY_DN10321_c0_g1~~TRINITY_DN10321_c0_g1_i1.p3  ORF type:complete len:186 (-),score=59.35 TRINITY_DN10321_c0_g1_i1:450-1007(-)